MIGKSLKMPFKYDRNGISKDKRQHISVLPQTVDKAV